MVDRGDYKQDKILFKALHYIFIMFFKLEILEVSHLAMLQHGGTKAK